MIGLVLLPRVSASQQATPPDSVFSISSVYTSTAPIIDGVVSDSVWALTDVATSFIQYEPAQGQPSAHQTRSYILYDDTYLYVAFVFTDSLPPTAQLNRRDANLLNDDSAILLLATFDDNQSAYYFLTNALGTQTDGRIANDGRTTDDTWDATWQAAASRDENGWSVEMAIPFTSIKYSACRGLQYEGLSVGKNRLPFRAQFRC